MKFSIKDIFSKCDQIRRKLRIWSCLLKNSIMENFIFCAVSFIIKAQISCEKMSQNKMFKGNNFCGDWLWHTVSSGKIRAAWKFGEVIKKY